MKFSPIITYFIFYGFQLQTASGSQTISQGSFMKNQWKEIKISGWRRRSDKKLMKKNQR
jgi:hypothetical protein